MEDGIWFGAVVLRGVSSVLDWCVGDVEDDINDEENVSTLVAVVVVVDGDGETFANKVRGTGLWSVKDAVNDIVVNEVMVDGDAEVDDAT